MWEIHLNKTDRLDRVLRGIVMPGAEWMSRQAWEYLISKGFIRVDGRIVAKAGEGISAGALIQVRLPEREIGLLAAKMEAQLVWMSSDRSWAVFSKNPLVDSYPLYPWDFSAFANQVVRYLEIHGPISMKEFASLAQAPVLEGGTVQRLDRATSGLIAVAFNAETKRLLRELFSSGAIEKGYQAIVHGDARGAEGPHQLRMWAPKGGHTRVGGAQGENVDLRVRVLRANDRASLVEVLTNRGIRHVVRAALGSLGIPILGDSTYGSGEGAPFHQLHANRLSLIQADQYSLEFPSIIEVRPPESFLDCLRELGLN